MQLRLEHQNLTLQTLSLHDVDETGVTIGRKPTCALRAPKTDSNVSGEHARVYRRAREFWIEDLKSTNGIFHKGKRILKRKLVEGDQISFGNCVLSVEPDPAGSASQACSYVMLPPGHSRKRKFLLEKTVTTIGSLQDADIRLTGELVSREHAEIRRLPEGGYWLVDLHSKNGTSVNDVPLPADKERLLKEQDKIAVAQHELVFFDGSIPRVTSKVWLKVAVILFALGVAWGGYGLWQQLTPAAHDFLRSAERLAAREDFSTALEELNRAAAGRGYRERELEITSLRRSINEWQHVAGSWERARENLESGDWVAASRQLAGVTALGREAWSWNDNAPRMREEAREAKLHLDNLLVVLNAARREEVDRSQLQQVIERGNETTAALQGVDKDHLLPMREAMGPALERLSTLMQTDAALTRALDMLLQHPPPVKETLQQVESLRTDATGAVRRRAEIVHPPLLELSHSQDRLHAYLDALLSLQFDEVMAMDLELPSVEACAVDPRLSQTRNTISNMGQNLVNAAASLQNLVARLSPEMPLDGSPPPTFARLTSPVELGKALACDILDHPLPRRTRDTPESAYDTLLGLEEFYLRLQTLPEPFDPELLGGMPAFVPDLRRVEELCRNAQRLVDFLEQPENQWLRQRDVHRYESAARSLLQRRNRFLAQGQSRLGEASGREKVIWGGILSSLSPSRDAVLVEGQPVAEWTRRQFQELRAEMLAQHRAYIELPPAEQIRMREQLLRIGLPGDGILRPIWAAARE